LMGEMAGKGANPPKPGPDSPAGTEPKAKPRPTDGS
jgi:hypothetical protein